MPGAQSETTRVTTLELFFSLVFVFTITQLTAVLYRAPTLRSAAQVVLMLGVIWWMYGGYAWMSNAVSAHTTNRRLLLLGGMGGYFGSHSRSRTRSRAPRPGRPRRDRGVRRRGRDRRVAPRGRRRARGRRGARARAEHVSVVAVLRGRRRAGPSWHSPRCRRPAAPRPRSTASATGTC